MRQYTTITISVPIEVIQEIRLILDKQEYPKFNISKICTDALVEALQLHNSKSLASHAY